MTRKEAIGNLRHSIRWNEMPKKEAIDMAIKELNSSKKKNKWIPCSERMPEEPYSCIVTIDDEEPITGKLFEGILPYFVGWDGDRWNDADGDQCPFEVIAWMPLPTPYKSESEES